jgi:uncharacterized protein (DUF2141 family)
MRKRLCKSVKILSRHDDKYLAGLLLLTGFYIAMNLSMSGCANSTIPITGGPKDTIPPVLLAMTPPQRTTEFKGKELVFTFNEYVQLKDQSKNFVISPPLPDKKPELKIRGKSIVVKLPSLADSVTYYIDFGASVVDVNESNPADYLNFTFSTGSVLDTMLCFGRVVDAFTLAPVDRASVFLYEDNTDSIVYRANPSALSITNKSGVFIIKGLKEKPYKFVAISDKNSNLRYDPGVDQIAFADTLIQPFYMSASDSVPFDLLPVSYMFEEQMKRQALTEYKRPEQRLIYLKFNEINPVIQSFTLDRHSLSQTVPEPSPQNDTLKYWLTGREVSDSIFAELVYLKTDTANQLSPDTAKLKFIYTPPKRKNRDKDEEEEITPISVGISAVPTAIMEQGYISFSFKTPLLKVDTSKISLFVLSDDGREHIPLKINSFERDSVHLRFYRMKADWKIASKYVLEVLPEAFVDIYSITNDTVSQKFETADPEKFGKLILSIENSDRQYILQLMKDKNVVQEKIISGSGKLVFQYLAAGKYRIRLIEDSNANKKWDAGIYLSRKQPERVTFVEFTNNEFVIEIKSNWEHEQTIDATKLFMKPPQITN